MTAMMLSRSRSTSRMRHGVVSWRASRAANSIFNHWGWGGAVVWHGDRPFLCDWGGFMFGVSGLRTSEALAMVVLIVGGIATLILIPLVIRRAFKARRD